MTSSITSNTERRNRWYFGGISSTTACCFTHPLDVLKVHLQTQQEKKFTLLQLIRKVYHESGIFGFYGGLSAAILRQVTYTTARLGVYEGGKTLIDSDTLFSKIGIAIAAGTIGGIIGVPSDMVNVRMQNDMKLPPEQRRNYKHALDGLIRICREEGLARLFVAAPAFIPRGIFMTIGQNVSYDQIKKFLIHTPLFEDNIYLHITTSILAAGVAIGITQPLDVIKTRSMNARPGEFHNAWHIVVYTAKVGPLGFFKGSLPAFLRSGPHITLLYVIMEQLRLHFGVLPEKSS